jgi:hypothetical protein
MQRRDLEFALHKSAHEPKVGQIWTTRGVYRRTSSPSRPLLSLLVIVLRIVTRPFSSGTFVDVAPVTEDAALAAEWSLVFSEDKSGLGSPVVIHLDFQVTATTESLGRYFGSLSGRACESLVRALELYDVPELPVSLACGFLGQEAVRELDAWQLLQTEFERLIMMLSAPLLEVDEDGSAHHSVDTSATHASIECFARPPSPEPSKSVVHERPHTLAVQSSRGSGGVYRVISDCSQAPTVMLLVRCYLSQNHYRSVHEWNAARRCDAREDELVLFQQIPTSLILRARRDWQTTLRSRLPNKSPTPGTWRLITEALQATWEPELAGSRIAAKAARSKDSK